MNHRLFTDRDARDFDAAVRHVPPDILRKAASVSVNPNLFADPVRGILPVDTPERTIVSAVAFLDHPYCDKVANQILAAVEHHGVEVQVDEIRTQAEALEKCASTVPSAPAALTVKTASGAIGFYPIQGLSNILGSARAVHDDYLSGRLPPRAMRDASQAIVKAASRYNVALPDTLEKYREVRLPDLGNAVKIAELRRRVGFAEDEVQLIVEGLKSASQNEVEPLLDAWAVLDRARDVDYSLVLDPYRAYFSGPTIAEMDKRASEFICVGPDVVVPFKALREATTKRAQLEASFDAEEIQYLDKAASAADNIGATITLDELPRETQKRVVDFILRHAS